MRRNYRRRAIAVAVGLAPVVLMVASLAVGSSWPWSNPVGVALILVALPIAILDFFLAVIRPWVYRRRHKSMEGYRNISGIPAIGNLFAITGGVIAFGDWRAAVVGLFALILDVGGLPWFVVVTWRDPSFWNEKPT
jgi:hypothetical protein